MAKHTDLPMGVGSIDGMVYGLGGPDFEVKWDKLDDGACLGLPATGLAYLRDLLSIPLGVLPCRLVDPTPAVFVVRPAAGDPSLALVAQLRDRGIPLRQEAMGIPVTAGGFSFDAMVGFSAGHTFLLVGDGASGVVCAWEGGRNFYDDPSPLGDLRALAQATAQDRVIRPQPDLTPTAVVMGQRSRPAVAVVAPPAARPPVSGMKQLRDAGFVPLTEEGVRILRMERQADGAVITVRNADGASVVLAKRYRGVVIDATGATLQDSIGDADAMLEMLQCGPAPGI